MGPWSSDLSSKINNIKGRIIKSRSQIYFKVFLQIQGARDWGVSFVTWAGFTGGLFICSFVDLLAFQTSALEEISGGGDGRLIYFMRYIPFP